MEKWERWIPEIELPALIYLEKSFFSEEGFICFFKDETEIKSIIFSFEKEGLLSYRETDEGSFLKTFDYLYANYEPEYFQGWTLFKVKESSYLQWFKEQSLSEYEKEEVEHYVFYTYDIIIEVLSLTGPKIKIKG